MSERTLVEGQRLENDSLLRKSACIFEDCIFLKVILKEEKNYSHLFVDCVFQSCDFSLTRFEACSFRGCEFRDCKLLGVNWSLTQSFTHSHFNSCIMPMSRFERMELKKTKFMSCELKESDFFECDLKNSDFESSNLEKARFIECNLEKANFFDSRFYMIDPTQNKIKGAKFNLPHAISFLRMLEIELME